MVKTKEEKAASARARLAAKLAEANKLPYGRLGEQDASIVLQAGDALSVEIFIAGTHYEDVWLPENLLGLAEFIYALNCRLDYLIKQMNAVMGQTNADTKRICGEVAAGSEHRPEGRGSGGVSGSGDADGPDSD